MPRGSGGTSAKRQAFHNNNSLAPPKRPSRSRSSSTATLPVTNPPPQTNFQEVSSTVTQIPTPANGVPNGWHGNGNGKAPGHQRYYDCIEDEAYTESANGTMGEHRKIEIKHSDRASSDIVPSTVLTSFPLLDTITLLIIFLQLPSLVLTVIHFLYALQTFVPPSTTLLSASAPTSLPSLSTLLLQGSNGAPSLLTILFADIVVALVSMFLWPSARTFLVDFAQAVIAIAFGAGMESGGSSKNAAVCAGLLAGVKFIQERFKLSDALENIQPIGHGRGMSYLFSGRIEPSGWIRSIIAIHIVAQWGMQLLRRWLIKRPETSDPSTSIVNGTGRDLSAKQKDKDPEAAAGASPQPLERENSVSGGKRKKKNQAQLLRNNQPMWATVANMIVHLAKEIERSRATSEAQNPNDETSTTALNAESITGSEQVWITKIGANEMVFIAGLIGSRDGNDGYHGLENGGVTGKNGTFPFFVRVNGIVWPQTDIYLLDKSQKVEEFSDGETGNGDEWVVEVTGLTGSTEYDFEFVRSGGEIFYTTSACTLPATQASSIAPPAAFQPSRPLSPVTTLLHSLAQAKSRLDESKTNLKSVRKAHKSGLGEIRKDIEKNRGLIGNDRGEERAFRRNLALKESIKRAEEEHEAMAKELENLESLPEKINPEWQEKKKQWQAEKQRLKMAQAKAAEDKSKADRRASAVESEITSLVAKKEKLATRLSKLRIDLDRLVVETKEGVGSYEKKQHEREVQEERRETLEKDFVGAITRLEFRINEYTSRAHENWSTFYALESAALQQTTQMGLGNNESMFTGSARNSGVFNSSPGMMLHDPMAMDASFPGGRERSSSIFSDGSVVTNVSELGGNTTFMPAFEPIGTRGNSMEYTPVPIGIERKYSG